MLVDDAHEQEVLQPRGIDASIYGYQHDGIPRYASLRSYDDAHAWHTHPTGLHGSIVKQAGGGLIVNRWDIDGKRLPSYIRPDAPVVVDPRQPGKTSKYVYTSERLAGDAKLIDVHPLALPFMQNNPREVYFCIEGCFKSDAMLSLPGVTTKAVCSVPAVWLWEVQQTRFEPYRSIMRRADVVWVIPDCDYLVKAHSYLTGRPDFINMDVRFATDRCVYWLREQGIEARYLIPPYLPSGEGRFKMGIDDILARGGNLERWDKENNPLGVHRFSYNAYKGVPPQIAALRRKEQRAKCTAFLQWLTAHHGLEGVYRPSHAAQDLNMHPKAVQRSKNTLIELGLLKVWPGAVLMVDGEFVTEPSAFRFNLTLDGVVYHDWKSLHGMEAR